MSVNGLSTESTLLLDQRLIRNPHNEKLENCVTAICERQPSEDAHLIARRVLKGSAMAISAIAKIPFIPISLQLGSVLGPITIYGNTAGFFVLEYWAAAGAINDVFGPKTQAEVELLGGEKKGKAKICRTIVVISAASLVALSSQLPTALAGVAYNPEQFKIVAGLVLLVAGALIPVRSLQLSIEQIRHLAQKTVKSEIKKIQGKMVALLRVNQGAFIQKNREGKVSFVNRCNEIRSLASSSEEKTNQYTLTLLQNDNPPISRAKRIVRACFNYTGLGIGTVLAGFFEYALGDYTYDLTKQELVDSTAAGVIFATLAVGSTAYLYGKSIIMTTQRVFNTMGTLVTGGEVRNLGWQLRPKLSFALTAIGLLTDVCALGPTYVIFGGFYDDNEIEHQLFPPIMCASLFLLLFTSTLDIIDEVVTYSIAKGSEEEREMLKISGEFHKLAELLEKSPTQEFVRYLTNMDESTRKTLMDRMNVSTEQLAGLISNA